MKRIFPVLLLIFTAFSFSAKAQNNIAKEILDAHNKIRAEVGMPPLKWSKKLANHARDWAIKLKNNNCGFRHRPNNPYGENLAMRWQSNAPKPADFVAQWYKEKGAFDTHFLDRNGNGNVINTCCGNFMKYGHYSQMVWEKTTEVGCAIVKCGNKYICVCNYNPAGNYSRQKPFKKIKKSNRR